MHTNNCKIFSPVDIRRHISCEVCDYSVSGGYDPELNQVIFFCNIALSQLNICQS